MLKLEGSTTHMETQQKEEVTDRIASTMNGNCDVIDENVSEEEKKRKKKTRRKNNSKITGSENGYVLVYVVAHLYTVGINVAKFVGPRRSKEYGLPTLHISITFGAHVDRVNVSKNAKF